MALSNRIRTGSKALLVYAEGDCDTVTVLALTHEAATVRLPRYPGERKGRVVTVCHEDIGLGVDDDLTFVMDDGCTTFDHNPPTPVHCGACQSHAFHAEPMPGCHACSATGTVR